MPLATLAGSPVDGRQKPEAEQRSEKSRLEGEVVRGRGGEERKGCSWGWASLKGERSPNSHMGQWRMWRKGTGTTAAQL